MKVPSNEGGRTARNDDDGIGILAAQRDSPNGSSSF